MSQLSIFIPKRKKSYHNTVPIQGKELVRRNAVNERQEAFILAIFEENPAKTWTAWEMICEVGKRGRTIPRTSIKRSLTNLVVQWEKIEKTLELRDGEYPGFKNRAYKLIKK